VSEQLHIAHTTGILLAAPAAKGGRSVLSAGLFPQRT